jgi:hypothetical protein
MSARSSMSVAISVALAALTMAWWKFVREPEVERAFEVDLAAFDRGEESGAVELIRRGDLAIPPLLARLDDESLTRELREDVIAALAAIGSDAVAAELRARLEPEFPPAVRYTAIEALERLRDTASLPRFAELAGSEPVLRLAQRATIARVRLGDGAALGDLAALRDPATCEDLRVAAAETEARFAAGSPQLAPISRTGGLGREPGAPIVHDDLVVRRDGERLEVEVAGDPPYTIVLDGAGLSIVIDVELGDDGVAYADVSDVAPERAPYPRCSRLPVELAKGVASFTLPRVGTLVAADEPRAARVLR